MASSSSSDSTSNRVQSNTIDTIRKLVSICTASQISNTNDTNVIDLFPQSSFNNKNTEYIYLYKAHMNAVMNLIRSDVQSKQLQQPNEQKNEILLFPISYIEILEVIDEIINTCKTLNHPIYILTKLIKKKEGLPKYSNLLTSNTKHDKIAVRDIIEVKRRSERVLSMILLALISHKIAFEVGISEDFVFFAKPLLELVYVQDRHMAFVVLCKGLFAPNYQMSAESGI